MLHWCILAFLCRLAPVFTPVLRTRCHRSMHNWNPEIWKSTSSMCIYIINNQSKRLELNMDKYRSRINSDQRPIMQKWIWWNSWNAHPGSPPRPNGRFGWFPSHGENPESQINSPKMWKSYFFWDNLQVLSQNGALIVSAILTPLLFILQYVLILVI